MQSTIILISITAQIGGWNDREELRKLQIQLPHLQRLVVLTWLVRKTGRTG